MLMKMPDREKELTIKNIIAAVKDIDKLNKRGYNFLYLASGFIAHYNLHGFIDNYRENSLRDNILNNQSMNTWNNFSASDKDYEYYHQKGEIYKEICNEIKDLGSIPLKAKFCKCCGQRIS